MKMKPRYVVLALLYGSGCAVAAVGEEDTGASEESDAVESVAQPLRAARKVIVDAPQGRFETREPKFYTVTLPADLSADPTAVKSATVQGTEEVVHRSFSAQHRDDLARMRAEER
jgi:hypothetical protein